MTDETKHYEIFNEYSGHGFCICSPKDRKPVPQFYIVRNADKYRDGAHGFALASFLCFVIALLVCVVMVRSCG